MLATINWCLAIVSALSICSLATGSPVECTERCKFGFEKDANGEELCECFDPCQDVACGEDQVCYPQYELCALGAPCPPPPVGVCVPDTVEVPSIRYKRSAYRTRGRHTRPRPGPPPRNPNPRPRWP